MGKNKNKAIKQIKPQIAKENIDFFFNLLQSRKNPDFDKEYIQEIKRLSQGFNIRLTTEQKLKFCRKCSTWFDSKNIQKIRIDTKNFTKNYICPVCNNIKRFSMKKEN